MYIYIIIWAGGPTFRVRVSSIGCHVITPGISCKPGTPVVNPRTLVAIAPESSKPRTDAVDSAL
jgi:hypothetical protein